MSIKKLLLAVLISLCCHQLMAQNARLYINKQLVSLHSVHFLEDDKIDSIKFYIGADALRLLGLPTKGIDSVFVIFKTNMNDLDSYHDLLTLFHLDKRAQALPLDIGSIKHRQIKDRALMVFNRGVVSDLIIDSRYDIPGGSVFISQGLNHRTIQSTAGKRLRWLQGYVNGYGDNSYFSKFKW